MNNSFVYSWSDKNTSKVYVGVHKGHEQDGYICSSKSVLKEYAERPKDFIRQIIAKGEWKDCIIFEKKINQQLIKNTNTTYNRHAYPAIVNKIPPMLGKKHSEETKKKLMGRVHSPEVLNQISLKLKGRISPRKGVSLSEETKTKISEKMKGRVSPMKGRVSSALTKEKLSKAHMGKIVSEETRKKLSDSAKNQWLRAKGA